MSENNAWHNEDTDKASCTIKFRQLQPLHPLEGTRQEAGYSSDMIWKTDTPPLQGIEPVTKSTACHYNELPQLTFSKTLNLNMTV